MFFYLVDKIKFWKFDEILKGSPWRLRFSTFRLENQHFVSTWGIEVFYLNYELDHIKTFADALYGKDKSPKLDYNVRFFSSYDVHFFSSYDHITSFVLFSILNQAYFENDADYIYVILRTHETIKFQKLKNNFSIWLMLVKSLNDCNSTIKKN